MKHDVLTALAVRSTTLLYDEDPVLADALEREYRRQEESLAMVASCSVTHPSVLACEGAVASNVTAEGYAGARFHAGCRFVDEIERLAIERAKTAFGARYANVQPHSASTANQIVMSALLQPGDTLLGMELDCGGHLSHGARVNVSGKYFQAVHYGLDAEGAIDYAAVEELARRHRPRLIVCGTTAYPRTIDFARFREIADATGAYLLADITHIAGLVVAGLHPSPIDAAHVTTCCTHKQMYGPRGGLILIGRDVDLPALNGRGTIADALQRGLFPFMQGAPLVNAIVAKARALARATTPEFRALCTRIVTSAKALAAALIENRFRVVSNGTDNHIVLVDVLGSVGLTGIVAQRALEECNIIVNKNTIPGETKSPGVASGIRIGTNSLALRNVPPEDVRTCAAIIWRILSAVCASGDREYELDAGVRARAREEVRELCRRYPIPGYPSSGGARRRRRTPAAPRMALSRASAASRLLAEKG